MASKAVWGTALILILGSVAPATASDEITLSLPNAEIVLAPARPEGGSRTLNVLYGSYAALQVLDMTTTISALKNGAHEVNPVIAATGGRTAQFMLIKAGTGAATMALTKVLAKKNKKAAIVTMLALNGVTAAVVAHNMRNARR